MAEKTAAAAAEKSEPPIKKQNAQIAMLVKNQFWILSGIIVLTSLAVWYFGVGALSAQFQANRSEIDAQFNAMDALRSKRSPPGKEHAEKVHAKRVDLEKQVLDAWAELYQRQIRGTTIPANAKDDARRTPLFAINSKVELNPVGVMVTDWPDTTERNITLRDLVLMEKDDRDLLLQEHPTLTKEVETRRNIYGDNNVLKEDFKSLFDLLDLRHEGHLDVFQEPNNGKQGDPPQGVLVWNPSTGPRDLRNRYARPAGLTADHIYMTYEDIWVFRSLFTVIQRINSSPIDVWLSRLNGGDPTETHVDQANVPIKRIDYCDIGKYAIQAAALNPGTITTLDMGLDGLQAAVDDLNADGVAAANDGGLMIDTAVDGDDPFKGRYLDGRNKPVEDPSNPPFTEYRQMAVQIKVLMDQRLVPVLISACANAPLPIETRQVRMSFAGVDVVRKVDAGAAAAQAFKVEQSPHDAIVMIRGIVYIYLPPKLEKLGKGSDPDPAKRDYGIPKKDDAGV